MKEVKTPKPGKEDLGSVKTPKPGKEDLGSIEEIIFDNKKPEPEKAPYNIEEKVGELLKEAEATIEKPKTRRRRRRKRKEEVEDESLAAINIISTSIINLQDAALFLLDEKAVYAESERIVLLEAWNKYLKERIKSELSPEIGLLIVQTSLIIPRIRFVKKSHFQGIWTKIKGVFKK